MGIARAMFELGALQSVARVVTETAARCGRLVSEWPRLVGLRYRDTWGPSVDSHDDEAIVAESPQHNLPRSGESLV